MVPKLNVGDLVKTNYDTGQYRIIKIERGCTCPRYIDSLDDGLDGYKAPASRPHIHLTVETLDGKGPYYLNGFDEETLWSVWNNDRLELLPPDTPVQTSMF